MLGIPGKYIWYTVTGLLAFYIGISYNGHTGRLNAAHESYAQIQNQMQRQSDLIPNMVKVVERYAQHESKTLTAVTEARAKMTAISKIDPQQIASNPALQKQLIDAAAATSQAMLSLSAVREAYPDLKANQQFNALMTVLEGAQNRITDARRRNQIAVREYNVGVQKVPGAFVARTFDFKSMPYFEASAAAQSAPEVKFH